jgi:hypothetical protein
MELLMASSRRLSDYLPSDATSPSESISRVPSLVHNDSHSRVRIPEYLRRGCARKLQSIDTSNVFRAILASLLEEDWTTPNIIELRFSRGHRLLGRSTGAVAFKPFRCVEVGLIRNVHGIAAVAELDGDELGYLLGRVAKIKIM